MEYPKVIVLNDPELKALLEEKGTVVDEGRRMSEIINTLTDEMAALDIEIQEMEKTIDLGDIERQAEKITAKFNKIVKEMDDVKAKIFARMREKMPPEKRNAYDQKEKEKTTLEQERVKIGMRIQTFNDRIRPFTDAYKKKYCKEKGDTFNTLELKEGKVLLTIVNDFDDFAKRWELKQKAPQDKAAAPTNAI